MVVLEPIDPDTQCVWCWQEILEGQPVLNVGKDAKAHLGCDSRMLTFITNLEEYL